MITPPKLTVGEDSVSHHPVAQPHNGMAAPLKVLVVEDEVIVALELQNHLERLGYDVVGSVTSGEKAVRQAAQLQPNLVLMDIRLDGDLDGIEAARRIRAAHDIPIIFLTAFGDEETLERAKETGPFGFILKPFKERELFATIEVALSKYRSEHRLQQSHDDLMQILDGLRLGTAMTDETGRITFLSRVARSLLGYHAGGGLGLPWEATFPFAEATLQALRAILAEDAAERTKVPARVSLPRSRPYQMEIEVQDDPRNPARHIFVFYDVTEVYDLRRLLNDQARFHDLIGESEVMQIVFRQIEDVARVDTTVLIEGQTGTGKELVARAIHDASHRRDKPFIVVNCAALTETLAASQLFGHKRGAFTGAVSDQQGYFGAADGGTLFLDEIGDIPLDVQVNLLRVLEQRTIARVGETKPRPVDVRIVAASHRNLPDEVEQGRFRADLLYRIRVARIELPPLRARRHDIPLLVQAFLSQSSARLGKDLSDVSHAAMRCMLDYGWPGNVRELRNAIEYAAIRSQGPLLQREDLPPEVRDIDRVPFDTVLDSEQERIRVALRQTGGNRKEAAKLLGMSRATFYRRLAQYGIGPE